MGNQYWIYLDDVSRNVGTISIRARFNCRKLVDQHFDQIDRKGVSDEGERRKDAGRAILAIFLVPGLAKRGVRFSCQFTTLLRGDWSGGAQPTAQECLAHPTRLPAAR